MTYGRLSGSLNTRRVRVEVERTGHQREARHLGLAAGPTRGTHLLGRAGRSVVLGPGGAGAHEDDVGDVAEREEHRPVGRPAEAAAALVDRDGAVERGDHVDQQPRPVGGGGPGLRGHQRGDVVDVAGVGPQASHGGEPTGGRLVAMVDHAPAHHHIAHPHAEPHRSNRAGWLRAAVLGANDGVVSTACLMVGVAGAGASYAGVRTAGIAGLAAGALSMAVGEYVSVASQRDIEHADLRIERQALEEHPAAELRELAQIWEARGIEPELAMEVARQLTAKDALEAHARDELGLTRETAARPVQAARSLGGGLHPRCRSCRSSPSCVAPNDGRSAVVVAASIVALAGLGWIGAVLGAAKRSRAIARVGLGGTAAMAITLLIGELTGAALG